MKKFFVYILFLTIICPVFGQSFYGGIIAGTTISQVDGDNYGGYHKISPLGGFYVRNTFSEKWGTSVGLEYKRKGSKEVQKNQYHVITRVYNLSLDYIELPFFINYKIESIGVPGLFNYNLPNDLFIEFGVSYSYLLHSKEDINGSIDPLAKAFRKYEVADHLGLTYRLNPHWLIYWRFSYTFIFLPIREHPGGQVYWFNRGQYNHNMSFSIKYEF